MQESPFWTNKWSSHLTSVDFRSILTVFRVARTMFSERKMLQYPDSPRLHFRCHRDHHLDRNHIITEATSPTLSNTSWPRCLKKQKLIGRLRLRGNTYLPASPTSDRALLQKLRGMRFGRPRSFALSILFPFVSYYSPSNSDHKSRAKLLGQSSSREFEA